MPVPTRLIPHIARLKAAGFAFTPTFFGAEVLTGQMVVAGLLALVSAVVAAWLASRPGVIRERSQSKQSEEEQHIGFLQERIRYHSQVVVLVRTSKHNAFNYIDSLHAHVGKLREQLRTAGVEPVEFTFKYHDDLCGDEDRGMLELIRPPELASRSGEIHGMGGHR